MTADRRAEAERLAALPEGDRVIDITYRAAEIERALIAAENAGRKAGIVEAANYVWFADDRIVPNMNQSEFIRRALAMELREKSRALRTDAGTDAGEETGT